MPRLRVSGSRKTAICDALLRVAAAEGISGLTMERLAREVGVTPGALFRHFESRDAMLDAAARRIAEILEGTLPPRDLPPLDRVRLFFLNRLRMLGAQPGIPQLVVSDQFAKALPPAGARLLRGVIARSVSCIVEGLAEAAARGEVRRDVPPRELALLVMGSLLARGLLLGHLAPGGGEPVRPSDPDEAWRGLHAVLRS